MQVPKVMPVERDQYSSGFGRNPEVFSVGCGPIPQIVSMNDVVPVLCQYSLGSRGYILVQVEERHLLGNFL